MFIFCGLFQYMIVERRMIEWLMNWKEFGIKRLWYFPGGTMGNHKNLSRDSRGKGKNWFRNCSVYDDASVAEIE
jgi:hypothetical protein